jgi:PAS domain S-box-containing protein
MKESQKKDKQYKRIFQFSPQVIGIIDTKGNVVEVNRRVCDWLGYKPKEVIGKNFLQLPFLSEESKIKAQKKLAQIFGNNNIPPYELEFVTKKGELRVGRIFTNPIKDGKGGLKEILVMAFDITERKRAEVALRENEALFRSIVENSHAGILIVDDSYCFTYVNDELCRMLGYSRREIMGQDFRNFLDEENQKLVAARYVKRQRGKKVPSRYEFNVVRKDGRKRRVEISSTVIRDKLSHVRTVAQILDITERKQAEERLRVEKASLDGLFESAQEGIVMSDLQGRVTRVNSDFSRLFGYKREEVLGRDVDELVVPKKYLKNGISFTKKVAAGRNVSFEAVRQRKDGKLIDVSVLASPIIADGKVVAIYAIYRNITERKQAEENLRLSEEKNRNLVELSPDAILFLDMKGTIIACNTFMTKATGYSKEEIVGKHLTELELLPDENTPKYMELLYAASKGQVPKPFDVTWYHKDRTAYLAEIRIGFIKERGENIGVQVVARDITERKQAEERIRTSLREREVMLREIHHRVKNNMQIISSLLRLQSRQIKDKRVLDIFNVGQNRIRSMALIHESLYQSIDLSKINFSDYIKRLTTHLLSMYRAGMNRIRMNVNVSHVFLDINRAIPCGLIINELVSNSLKHAFPDGKKGEIRIVMKANKRGKHTLVVRDTGVGFPEDLDFYRTETLGMQLVTDLVSQLEGTIKLKRDKGTEFRIIF